MPEIDVSEIVHIASEAIRVGPRIRQRCGWCGAVLLDEDMSEINIPEGQDPTPTTWPVMGRVAVYGSVKWLASEAHGPLPKTACARIDPEVTGEPSPEGPRYVP